jgi:hypothetical protein
VSTITIYIPQENGNLTYVADVEDEDRADMALDAVLDELPRIANKSDTFVALIDGYDGGTAVVLTLEDPETVERRPKRGIAMSNGAATVEEPEAEDEAPAPRRRQTTAKRGPGRPRGSTAKKTTAAKTTPRRASGRKTPFTRNAKSDD